MSGRLIITTKKSYCPWNPANVERVLRDERLERERIDREQTRQLRREEKEDEKQRHQNGHINLFPEAVRREEEESSRLAQGRGLVGAATASNKFDADTKHPGILPVPLLGAGDRDVPFYMQTSSTATASSSMHLGISGIAIKRLAAGATTSDEITDKIMRDQCASREDYRKRKNDPMSRFYIDSNDDKNIYTGRQGRAEGFSLWKNDCPVSDSPKGINYSLERPLLSQQQQQQQHEPIYVRTKSRKRKSSSFQIGEDDDRSGMSSSSSSCNRRGERSRKHHQHSKRIKRKDASSPSSSSHHHRRHRTNCSDSNSTSTQTSKKKKKRHKHNKTKRKRHPDDDGVDDKQRHNSPPISTSLEMDSVERKNKSKNVQLSEMRRRRHAREAREIERQRTL